MPQPNSQPRHTQTTSSRAIDRLSVATFVLALWLPLVVMGLQPTAQVSVTENRFLAPAPWPTADWQNWQDLPNRTEAWFNDHLGLRNSLIRNQARLDIGLFDISPSSMLLIGKQGWLFFGEKNAIAIYRRTAPFSPEALTRWQQVLEEREAWLAERDIAFLFVVVPDKHSVYSEYMPDSLPRSGDTDPVSQLVTHLQTHSTVDVLDLRPILDDAKPSERTYHRTDTHWNGVGANLAYRAILARLRELVPALADAEPIAVRREVRETPGMGLAAIVGLGHLLREESIEMIPIAPRATIKREFRIDYNKRVIAQTPFAWGVDDRSLPRAVMFRDSFANALIPYLSEHFQRILYVWQRDVSKRAVLTEKPDVVIQEVVGRFLGRRPLGIEEASKPKGQRRRGH
jgi:hypothetical protein